MKIIKASTTNSSKVKAVKDAITDELRYSSKYDIGDIFDLIDIAAKELVKLDPRVDVDSINCNIFAEPMDVDATQFEIRLRRNGKKHYVFLVYEEDAVYIDQMPQAYFDAGLVDEEDDFEE